MDSNNSQPIAQPQTPPDLNNVRGLDTNILLGIQQNIGQLLSDSKHYKDRIDQLDDKMSKQLDSIDQNVRKLENWKSYVLGGAAVVVVVIGVATTIIWGVVSKGIDVYVKTHTGETEKIDQPSNATGQQASQSQAKLKRGQ